MKVSLEGFVQEKKEKKLDLYHVLVRQHGEIVGKFDWRENRRDNIHSASKSFLSMAIGMAIDEGILSLDEHYADIFKDKLPANPSQNLLDITIRDAIMMATGHEQFILQGYNKFNDEPIRDAYENDDWVQHALTFEVPHKPGTFWKYNNFGPYLTAVVIQERTGQRLKEWLKPRLFAPLGIKNPQWDESPMGYNIGCGGLFLSTEELSKFGQLMLNKGEWNGKQLVPAAWVEEATSNHISNVIAGRQQHPDECAGYGYFFWMGARDHAYSARGYAGQDVIVLPDQDACVVVTGHEFNTGGIMDCVWNHIVPQLKAN